MIKAGLMRKPWKRKTPSFPESHYWTAPSSVMIATKVWCHVAEKVERCGCVGKLNGVHEDLVDDACRYPKGVAAIRARREFLLVELNRAVYASTQYFACLLRVEENGASLKALGCEVEP